MSNSSLFEDANINIDPAKCVINNSTIDYLLSNDINKNILEDFSATKTFYSSINLYRSLTKLAFEIQLKNGQRVPKK